MATNPLSDRIHGDDQARSYSVELLAEGANATDVRTFLRAALDRLLADLGVPAAAVARADQGRWRTIAVTEADLQLPEPLLSDVLDRDAAASGDNWFAAPLVRRSETGEILAVLAPGNHDDLTSTVDGLAAALGAMLSSVRARQQQRRHVERLEAILEIAGQWSQTLEMETLLTQMAEASTRLLDAERASIFLWDKPNKMLVGRPALGVDEGELRIPEDTGIVGQVISSGESRRVDSDTGQEAIDRKVDKQLGYETHTLLCVPLRAKGGELFGAFEIINKVDGNFTREDEAALSELATHAAIALENTQQVELLLSSRKQMADEAADRVHLIGESPSIEELRSTIRRVADTDLAILILGENGTGKEVVSQSVHYLSRRRDEPFVAVNCAALTETLLESELFGHEKGAFTDAHEARSGKFELASGGTLFLDEIGDLSLGGQSKLLRVLEEKVVVRVGGSRPIHTDARVIAATNQDLAEMVRNKAFREDLYFRLNVVTLELSPLRDRGPDVLLLAEHFLGDFCVKARRKLPKFTAEARKRLRQHAWPGNVRELRNLMERLAYLSQGDKIDAEDLAFILSPSGASPSMVPMDLPLSDATTRFQSEYVKKHIESAGGNMSDASRRLGLHRSNLYRKMRQLGMNVDKE